jgi:hypothetical protein
MKKIAIDTIDLLIYKLEVRLISDRTLTQAQRTEMRVGIHWLRLQEQMGKTLTEVLKRMQVPP